MTLKDEARRAGWKRVYLKVLLGVMGVVTAGVVLALGVLGMRDSEFAIMVGLGDGFMLLMAFAALAGMERKGVRWAAFVGSGLALLLLVALPVLMAMVWYVERSHGGYVSRRRLDWMGDGVAVGMVAASFFCLAAFVVAPRLRMGGRWVQLLTVLSLLVAGVLLSMTFTLPWDMLRGLEQPLMGSIVVGVAGTLVVMVLNRVASIPEVDVLSDVDQTVFLRCPRCLKEQEVAVGSGACVVCRLKIEITIEEPKCPRCRYNLRGLVEAVCPECGLDLRGGEAGTGMAGIGGTGNPE